MVSIFLACKMNLNKILSCSCYIWWDFSAWHIHSVMNSLFLQVRELFLQGGHLIQTLHPPPLTVLIIHLCSYEHMTAFTSITSMSVALVYHHPPKYKQLCFQEAQCVCMGVDLEGLFFLPELSPSSDTVELTVSSSSVLLPSCSGKSTSISSWLLSFFSRIWTGIVPYW